MSEEQPTGWLQDRTKSFALRVIRLVNSLPKTPTSNVIGNQLLRSGTSVGANYRSACRGRSKAEFIAKMGVAIEEADESLYWLELLRDSKIVHEHLLEAIMQETNELISMMVASCKTTRGRKKSMDKEIA